MFRPRQIADLNGIGDLGRHHRVAEPGNGDRGPPTAIGPVPDDQDTQLSHERLPPRSQLTRFRMKNIPRFPSAILF